MLLNWLIPNASIITEHPIYRIETRRQPEKTFSQLIPDAIKWLVRASVPLLILWLLWTVYLMNQMRSYTTVFWDMLWVTYAIQLFASTLPIVLLDLNCVLVTANSITKEKASGYWDYLIVADVNPLDAVRAKHGLAQISAWGMTSLLLGLRAAVFLVGILQLIFVANQPSQANSPIFQMWHSLIESPDRVLILLIGLSVYVLEPLWRMRAMTAMCVAVSARGWRLNMTILACYASIAGIWISQIFLAGFVLLITTAPLFDGVDGQSKWMIYVPVFSLLIYIYYRFVRLWSLRRAAAAAFRT